MKAFRYVAPLFLIISALFILLTSSTAFAFSIWTNETTGTSASGLNWYSITSSSDGTKLAAVAFGGDIWTSTNNGGTWTDATPSGGAHNQNWYSITSSSDGTKLAAVAVAGDIWTSTNSGGTWTNETTGTSASGRIWVSITSSSDGTKLAAVAFGGDIWTSTTTGATWVNETTGTSASGLNWYSIISSSDGTKLAAAVQNGDIWTSTNSGGTWTNETTGTSASGQGWQAITSSSDGTKLAAAAYGSGHIWTSSDSGVTWTNQPSASGPNWYSITSSSDGTKLAAVTKGSQGDIWTSSDSGVTWTNQTTGTSASGQNWYSITSSSDGTKPAAVAFGGDIWTGVYVSAPTVTTSAASPLTATSAILNGNITATGNQNATVTGFVWGTDTSYGATTTDNGSFAVGAFSTDISPLTCNTTYHFAAYATNPGGTGYGSDQTVTLACPPTVTSTLASSIDMTDATLNGSITATGGENPSTEGFVWGKDTTYGATTTATGSFGTGSFTAALSGLACNNIYHYAAYATNSGGTGYGIDENFTTSNCPNGPPVSGGSGGGGGAPTTPPPQPEIIFPDGTVYYLNSTSSTSTSSLQNPVTLTASTTLSADQVNQLVSLYTLLLQILQQYLNALMGGGGQ
jgi:hypothetical protein